MKPWEMLREYSIGITDCGPGEDFVNWFFENICKPDCDVICNDDHYIEGPEFRNMIGCFLLRYTENEAKKILDWLLENPGLEYNKGDGLNAVT